MMSVKKYQIAAMVRVDMALCASKWHYGMMHDGKLYHLLWCNCGTLLHHSADSEGEAIDQTEVVL